MSLRWVSHHPLQISFSSGLIDIRRQSGLTMLLVEQRVAEALESADRGYVLEAGHVVLEGNNETLRADDRVRKAYLGM